MYPEDIKIKRLEHFIIPLDISASKGISATVNAAVRFVMKTLKFRHNL